MKSYNSNEEPSYIQYLGTNNLYGWAMSKKLPTNGFKWIDSEKHLINEEFIKTITKMITKATFLKWMLNIQEDYKNYTVIYCSYQNEWK